MNPDLVTPVVLAWNEGPNLRRCLERLRWARQVVVLDSGSSDDTAAIAADFPNVAFHVRPFDNHTAQWNHGVDLAPTEWILSLDADYLMPEDFVSELRALHPPDDLAAYYARFRYCVFGAPLRATLYPPRAVLFRKDRCRYEDDGHTQLLRAKGPTALLEGRIDHDDRKPLSRWLSSQDNYAKLEVIKLLQADPATLKFNDRLRLWLFPAPILVFFYCLFARGLVLDGWRGWFYTWQRVIAEIILALRLLERRLNPPS